MPAVIALILPVVIASASAESAPRVERRMECGPYEQWCAKAFTTRDDLPARRILRIVCPGQGTVFIKTPKGVARLVGETWQRVSEDVPFPAARSIPDDLPGTLPWLPPTCFAKASDGALWVGTTGGLCRWEGERWRAFHSRRWLPDNHVNDVAIGQDGSVWAASNGGVARVFTRTMTLAEKAAHFQRILRERHVRRGLIGHITIDERRGDEILKYHQPSDDNDGLWTALYVAAESFRYAATKAADAKANATESMKALLFLEEVTSLPGFIARSYVPRGQGKQHGGMWYPSEDGKWDWKGDTSSDELDGHFLAYGIYYDLVDDAETRKRLVETCRRVMDRIIEGGYKYHGPGGRRTRWGMWAPEALNHSMQWRIERGLNSLGVLAYLKVAHHVTGDETYHRCYRELIDEHGYAKNTLRQKVHVPGVTNHSDDELAFISYYSLLRLEKDPKLSEIYRKSIERSWRIERPEHSPFFNYVYGGVTDGDFDLAESVAWLRNFPLDLIEWDVDNRGRRDLEVRAYKSRFDRLQSKEALPPSERALMRWNGNPYRLRGGRGGNREDDGTVWLLPYWMGRYHGFIVERK